MNIKMHEKVDIDNTYIFKVLDLDYTIEDAIKNLKKDWPNRRIVLEVDSLEDVRSYISKAFSLSFVGNQYSKNIASGRSMMIDINGKKYKKFLMVYFNPFGPIIFVSQK